MDFNEAFRKARRTTTKLKDLRITRVDLVDKGANLDRSSGLGSHVMICKRADAEPPSHEGAPEPMQMWQIERVAGAFVEAGADYGAAMATIMKHDPEAYACYRRENFR